MNKRSRLWLPLHSRRLADAFIQIWHTTYNKSICQKKEKQQYIAVSSRYSKDVHRTKYQALTITRLTHSPYDDEDEDDEDEDEVEDEEEDSCNICNSGAERLFIKAVTSRTNWQTTSQRDLNPDNEDTHSILLSLALFLTS